MLIKETKKWPLKTLEGKKVYFYPVFIADSQSNIECRTVIIQIDENKYTFNFLDLLMFCYFVGDEETRRKLANIQMRAVKYFPYDVTFKLSESEKKVGIAKRRIEIPIDSFFVQYAKLEGKKSQFLKKLKKIVIHT